MEPQAPTALSAYKLKPGEDSAHPWLESLRQEVEAHPAVNHLLLARIATGRFTRADFLNFSLQHHALVGLFTKYMELLLLKAPDSEQKLWLAKVLVDEYGEGSDGKDHVELYREYLRHVGADPGDEAEVPLCREVWQFVGEHLRICRDEPFLVGLGALGPGHEWAIPKMFSHIIPGLARAGVSQSERLYFDLHTEQDIDHASWMTEALAKYATKEHQKAEVCRGALLSLAARYRVWTGIERQIVAWRQPGSLEASKRGLLGMRGRKISNHSPGVLGELLSQGDRFLMGADWPVASATGSMGELQS